jgi:hypothetical protein
MKLKDEAKDEAGCAKSGGPLTEVLEEALGAADKRRWTRIRIGVYRRSSAASLVS